MGGFALDAQPDKGTHLRYGSTETPLGQVTVAVLDGEVCWLSYAGCKPAEWELELWSKSCLGASVRLTEGGEDVQSVIDELHEYFSGERRQFDTSVTFLGGTPFQRKVWQELLNIPYGEVRTYKDIAKAIGMPKAVRAVGRANNKNPISIIVPCHRVIGSNGALVGYGGGLDKKEYLLRLEGYLK
jgi:methylated-DNA-[protein]-cysteine S-methyltransferase